MENSGIQGALDERMEENKIDKALGRPGGLLGFIQQNQNVRTKTIIYIYRVKTVTLLFFDFIRFPF